MESTMDFRFAQWNAAFRQEAETLLPGEIDAVYGEDTRAVVQRDQFPYSAIVLLQVAFGQRLCRATGFLVKQDRVMTAAHAVYDAMTGRFADSVTIRSYSMPLRDDQSIGCLGGCCPDAFLQGGRNGDDWAVLWLTAPIPTTPISCADVTSIPQINQYQATIAGYPTKVRGSATSDLWSASGPVQLDPGQKLLRHTISVSGGQSGAPVLLNDNGNWCAVGVHCSDRGRESHARAFDAELCRKIREY